MPGYRFSVVEDGLVTDLSERVDLDRSSHIEREATEMLAQMMLDSVRQGGGSRRLQVQVYDWGDDRMVLSARLELLVDTP
ncbi:MAG: DUF6894 family protein [Phreatobacter sp.]|jgi:citrate lyase gamma subunit|uniref:DUF6894 family protein n=1 Tax=Phreatobacter sp. TaxID=1966341 RepID=UPI004035DCA4